MNSLPVLGAVLGSPVSHSLSPAIYNEAFRLQGIEASYAAINCEVHEVAQTLQDLWESRVRAVSVTMPLKEEVITYLERIDDNVGALNAANCLSRGVNGWIGHNTDGDGCCDALVEQGNANILGANAVVLGAGGTARSVALALVNRGAHVVVVNRTLAKAEELVHRVQQFCVSGGSLTIGSPSDLQNASILVNATSVGMNSTFSPVESTDLHSRLVILDAVYQPMKTQLLADGERVGARIIDGLWMLIQQARRQCVHQFGWKPDAQSLRNAAERELASRQK